MGTELSCTAMPTPSSDTPGDIYLKSFPVSLLSQAKAAQVLAQWPAHRVENIAGKCLCALIPGNWDSDGQYLQHLAPSWHPGALIKHTTLAENSTAKPQDAFFLCQGKRDNVHSAAVKGVIRNRDLGLRILSVYLHLHPLPTE